MNSPRRFACGSPLPQFTPVEMKRVESKFFAFPLGTTNRNLLRYRPLPNREHRPGRRPPDTLLHQIPLPSLIFTLYDEPASPLALETFVNIEDEEQRAEFVQLGSRIRSIYCFTMKLLSTG